MSRARRSGMGQGTLNIPHTAGSIALSCNATAAPMKDEGRRMKAEDSQQTMSRELQPKNRQVRLVYKRSNFAGKPPFLQLLGTLGAPSRRQSRLSMSLQQHEIGLEACPPRRPRNPVAAVPENCNIEFGLWKPNTSSFRVGDQVECTMEKEVRRHQKIHLALAIAEGESIAAWAQRKWGVRAHGVLLGKGPESPPRGRGVSAPGSQSRPPGIFRAQLIRHSVGLVLPAGLPISGVV